MSQKITSKQIDQMLLIAENLQKPKKNSTPNPFTKRLVPIIKSPEGKYFLTQIPQ